MPMPGATITTFPRAKSSRWAPKRSPFAFVQAIPAIGRPRAARRLSERGRKSRPGPTLGAVLASGGSGAGAGSAPPQPAISASATSAGRLAARGLRVVLAIPWRMATRRQRRMKTGVPRGTRRISVRSAVALACRQPAEARAPIVAGLLVP